MRDITERKQAEAALARERMLLRTLIDNLPGYIYIKDTEGRYLLTNVLNVRFLGLESEAEVLGRRSSILPSRKSRDRSMRTIGA